MGDGKSRTISPPPLLKRRRLTSEDEVSQNAKRRRELVPSPFQLTTIPELSAANNVETVSLPSLIGDEMVSSCWIFNFLFDVAWLMTNFHSSIRQTVDVTLVHGSWRQEDTNRQRIDADIEDLENVRAVKAHLPDPFGTHHTKAMVLFRRDDTAQIVIMSANMVPGDWSHLTQAVWKGPRMHKQMKSTETSTDTETAQHDPPMGSGARFKMDLLNYFKAYGKSKTGKLVQTLEAYDFTEIRAALIGSVPGKQSATRGPGETLWGWQGLKETIAQVPLSHEDANKPSTVVVQVSSIASLGSKDDWLQNLFCSLAPKRQSTDTGAHPRQSTNAGAQPLLKIVFPTADEIRRSIGGYHCGGSIHTPNCATAQGKKLLEYLVQNLHYWAGDGSGLEAPPANMREAGRRRVAPHIKTYVRFSDEEATRIDWAMITSANLSKQAWGFLPDREGRVSIQSFELGVVIWPGLFAQSTDQGVTIMSPTFKTDTPNVHACCHAAASVDRVVGLRMTYDWPLVRYKDGDVPWCNKIKHDETDWRGLSWPP